jgi:arylsulfatase A-like enzyme
MKLQSIRVLLPLLTIGILTSPLPAAAPPNILFLLSDDHSYPFLSCYGDPNVRTPALDQLAAGGMKFHRFFTSAPQCVPSRATFMTGRSPVAARITRFSSPLAKDELTFPEILRQQAGYHVGVCGRSYHLDGSGKRGDSGLGELLEKHGLRTFEQRFDYVRTGSDSEAATQAAEFLDQKPTAKPFCLWVNFSDPHHVWNAPAGLRPDPATLKLPAHWPDLPGMRSQLADYCAEVNRLDQSVKALLDLLASRGFADNTLVVFAGDNGAALPHGKGSLYDPGSNVPFLIRWPGVVKPGGDSRELISAEDLAPTVLAAAGLKPAEKMSGVSFLALLKGEPHEPRSHLFVERGPHGSAPVAVNMTNSGYDLSRAVRSDRYKFIYNCTPWLPYSPVDSAGGAAWREMTAANDANQLAPGLRATYFTTPRPVYELYDLDQDPSELNNLSGQPEVAAVERSLRLALAEKMIVDFDYLPLPAITGTRDAAKQKQKPSDRAIAFKRLDTDQDGKLSKSEFSADREPADAELWFTRRDTDHDGFISRAEYLANLP